jgi:hypothetical protein
MKLVLVSLLFTVLWALQRCRGFVLSGFIIAYSYLTLNAIADL